MKPVRATSLGLAVAAAVLGGWASLGAEEGPKAKKVCIDRREINSIVPLDDRHAFVKISAGRFYLFTLDKACQEFKLARQITISDARRVCGDGTTLLTFQYPDLGPIRCRVEAIDSVPDKNAALELIESRRPPE